MRQLADAREAQSLAAREHEQLAAEKKETRVLGERLAAMEADHGRLDLELKAVRRERDELASEARARG